MQLKKNDIIVMLIDGVGKYLRLAADYNVPIGPGDKIEFTDMWDVMLRPVGGPGGMAIDKAVIPVSKALDMDKDTPGYFWIPQRKQVTIFKLDPASSEYTALQSESSNILLPKSNGGILLGK